MVALVPLLLAGCGGGEDDATPTPTAEATVAPESTATMVPETGLGDVTWSTGLTGAGAPDGDLDTFSRENEVIHASVEATNLQAGETLTASWSINGTPVEGLDTGVTIDANTTSGWVSFLLTWNGAALWPTGTLEVMITTSTGISATGSIQIVSGQ